MTIIEQWNPKVNVTGLSLLNNVNDPEALDAPEDLLICLSVNRKLNLVYCPDRYHHLIKETSTGGLTDTITYDQQEMYAHDTQPRGAIVFADLRSCKRDNAYDIFELNGKDADPQEILENPYVRICLLQFRIPDYCCPCCKEMNSHGDYGYRQHYHRAVPEWMIWNHQMTMLVLLFILLERVQQFLQDLDKDTARGWVREGNRICDSMMSNSMIELIIEAEDPGKEKIQAGKKEAVSIIYKIVPPWMGAP